MQTFKLKAPIVGTETIPTGFLVLEIDAGETLRITDTSKNFGSVSATFQGRNVSVYVQDLRKHGELVLEKTGESRL